MNRIIHVTVVILLSSQSMHAQAKNVILFLGDAAGMPILHLASVTRYNQPFGLFIHSMPFFALVDTSAADDWVTDSAAGMTAIVTGRKTNNGIIAQSSDAIRGKKDGEVLQTILEYAEQRGLSTGVATNMPITDATSAACYAHSNERNAAGAIFSQIFKPRFGDGVDVIIGAGRNSVLAATQKIGLNVESSARENGYGFYSSVKEIPERDKRAIVLHTTSDFNLWETAERAIRMLSQNRKGYFLMVEWDSHTDNLDRGLRQLLDLDDTIRKTARMAGKDTLILFAADHSFDSRLRGGKRVEEAQPGSGAVPKLNIRMDNGHTGEPVLATAMGPGAKRLHGFMPNTQLFHIMMAAFGWEKMKE